MHVPKRSPRQEYRLKQQEQVLASPLIMERFPRLASVTAILEYFDTPAMTRNGQMKCKLNVRQARSALWFACPRGECIGGDFDLTGELAKAADGGLQTITGEIACHGTRRRADKEFVPCNTLLRYKFVLRYD